MKIFWGYKTSNPFIQLMDRESKISRIEIINVWFLYGYTVNNDTSSHISMYSLPSPSSNYQNGNENDIVETKDVLELKKDCVQ